MLRRLFVVVATVVVVAAMASLPELANPASGAPTITRAGTVIPTTVTAGGTTRFCGSGFVPGVTVDVMVGEHEATGVTTSRNGGFCLDLTAHAGATGPSSLLAVGRAREGGVLKVTGGVAITGSDALRGVVAAPAIGPLVSSSRPLVLELWAAAALLAVIAGLAGIAAERRRIRVSPGQTPLAQTE